MPSTYSPSLRLELIGNGEQAGNWGTTTNTNLGTLIEQAITGVESITMTGSTTLTLGNGVADQARNAVLVLTGTLASAADLIIPAVEKVYIVKNSTSNNQTVTVKTSGGAGIAIANGYTQFVYCDGTNVYAVAQSINPAVAPGTVSSIQLAAGTTGLLFGGSSSQTITTAGTFTFGGTLAVANGGTGRSSLPASGSFLISNGSIFNPGTVSGGNAITTTYNGTDLVINNAGVTSLTAGSGVTLSAGTGNIIISATGGGGGTGVTSFAGGTTGLTPATATPGAVTLGGILAVTNGGTGAQTLTGYVKGTGTSSLTGVAQIPTSDLTGSVAVTNGGTGSNTASGALTNLGAASLTTNTFSGTQTAPSFNLNALNARFWTDSSYTNLNFNTLSAMSYNGSSQYDVSIQGNVKFTITTSGCTAPAFTPTSDRSLKTDIQPVTGGYGRVMQYQPVTFKWVDPSIDNRLHEGFIAQDVDLVNPVAVVYNDGIACLDPMAIIADLVAAVQELSSQVQTLKAQIEKA